MRRPDRVPARLHRHTTAVGIRLVPLSMAMRGLAVPDDANLFYFFNPFDVVVLGQVIDNIVQSVCKVPRKCIVIYADPLHDSNFSSLRFSQMPEPGVSCGFVFTPAAHRLASVS